MVKTFTNIVNDYFIPINSSGIPSLVEYHRILKDILMSDRNDNEEESDKLFFYSLGFPQNRVVKSDGRSMLYKNMSMSQQYNFLCNKLRGVCLTDWHSRDSITRFRNGNCRKIQMEINPDLQYDGYSSEKQTENRELASKAMVIFESTKNDNLHFHIILKCKNRYDARLIHLILLDKLGINKKSDDADTVLNVKPIIEPEGIYDYMVNKNKKDYETLDWIKYKPLFLSEPIVYNNALLQEEVVRQETPLREKSGEKAILQKNSQVICF